MMGLGVATERGDDDAELVGVLFVGRVHNAGDLDIKRGGNGPEDMYGSIHD